MASPTEERLKNRQPLWLEGACLFMIDQRKLPHQLTVLRLETYPETIRAIQEMAVRGAGTLGVAGGFAMAQAALAAPENGFWESVEKAAKAISAARPTAKNLSHAVERVLGRMRAEKQPAAARQRAVSEAQKFYDENVAMSERIGQAGLPLLPKAKAVLTHCNAGWLACTGLGTALAPIFLAHQQGKVVFVIATETRPRGQGAKLTAWELGQAGVPHALVADSAAGHFMSRGEIGMVIVGADRIAANGDTANKIGTYTLAVLAKAHGIPFYVAAPSPTFDAGCPSGDRIPIEERGEEEVLHAEGSFNGGEQISVRVANPGVKARNPAFDVTPAGLITGFITEAGLIQPNSAAIAAFLSSASR